MYVGDAPWDVEASRALAWPFVGVGPRGDTLRALGASHVMPDLRDVDALMRGLEEAQPPA